MTIQVPFDPNQLRTRCLQSVASLIGKDSRYLFIDNNADILAVAHVDTVAHTPTFSKATLEGDKCYFSPAMDDRLGVYTLLDVLPQMGLTYDILLTTDEEKGMSTASIFKAPEGKQYNWIFEFDRRGSDVVFYQYEHTGLAKATAGYFKTGIGSFSDIAELDELGCAGMNIGTGYYNEHTYLCHMIVDVWEMQVIKFVNFFSVYANTHFPYTFGTGTKRRGYYNWGEDWGGWSEGKVWDYNLKKYVYKPTAPVTSSEDTTDYSERFLALSDGQTQPEEEETTVTTSPPAYYDVEAEFISYTNTREKYRLPDGQVEACDYCGGNAEFKINTVHKCAECDNEDWVTDHRYWM